MLLFLFPQSPQEYVLPPGSDANDPVKLSYAAWLPSDDPGAEEDRLVFVSAADNNVYVKEEWDSLPSAVSRVTGDGVEGEVYNGIPDWVYEEEVLGTNVVRF